MVYLRADAEAGTRTDGRRAAERARGGQQGTLRQGRHQAGPQERGPGRLRPAHGPFRRVAGRQGRRDAPRGERDGQDQGHSCAEGGRHQPLEDARRPDARAAGPSTRGTRVRGRLIVVSGPSGAGKSTLIREALEAVPELAYSVSATTRTARPGEVEGEHYVFLSREEFECWIGEGKFLEWAEYSGNLYGTYERKVEELLDAGRSVILEIELQGARKVRRKRPDAAMVFVRAPSLEETRRRLSGRATETAEAMETRLATAVGEVAARDEFDVEVVNGEWERARRDMIEIMENIVAGGKDAE
ncbi:MAG: guanylate kinase [Rubrobacter sp.]|nr:guanylate kinase [Rubrobacter sp.]MBA3952656.1 guanylate kinase [Rubrobacter sp.]